MIKAHTKEEGFTQGSLEGAPAEPVMVTVLTLGAGRGVGLEVSGCLVELTPAKARGYADLLRACADRAERP